MKKKVKTEEIEGVVAPEIVGYAEKHSSRPSAVRRAIKRETDKLLGKDADMQLGFTGGSLLAFLAKTMGAKYVLEVGTLTGGTTLAIAESLPPEGGILTLELDMRMIEIAHKFWERSPHGKKIRFVLGDAKKALRDRAVGTFDLAFIDADKPSYWKYFNLVLPLVRQGGLIVVDDVLSDGNVLHPHQSAKARTMDRFNKLVARDKRVEVLLLPTLDGLTLIRKK